MSIFDLLFIAMVVGTLAMLLLAVVWLFSKRWKYLWRSIIAVVLAWIMYVGVGAIVAIASPQRFVNIGSPICFDEMCFSVTGFQRVSSVTIQSQIISAKGTFYLVDVRISSNSRGRAQHESGRIAMLMDHDGTEYGVAEGLTASLAKDRGTAANLETDLQPGETATTTLIFDVPVNAKILGLTYGSSLAFYPPRIITGDEMHFLHKPTLVRLNTLK